MNNLVEIYVSVDNFMKEFLPPFQKKMLLSGNNKRNKPSKLSVSEMVTILICFHSSNYRTLKHFYIDKILNDNDNAFPYVSYSWFVRLQQSVIMPFFAYLESKKGKSTGINFMDSTSIKVCHNKRISRNKVFAGMAQRSKSTMGWFYGFKLHLVVNDAGEILSYMVSGAKLDDRKAVPNISKDLLGKLFADKGYISRKLKQSLKDKGLELITNIRKNMNPVTINALDKILLRKRFIVETINDQLKNISQIEHSRHRSPINFIVNLIAGLTAYCHKEKKPSLNIKRNLLPV